MGLRRLKRKYFFSKTKFMPLLKNIKIHQFFLEFSGKTYKSPAKNVKKKKVINLIMLKFRVILKTTTIFIKMPPLYQSSALDWYLAGSYIPWLPWIYDKISITKITTIKPRKLELPTYYDKIIIMYNILLYKIYINSVFSFNFKYWKLIIHYLFILHFKYTYFIFCI